MVDLVDSLQHSVVSLVVLSLLVWRWFDVDPFPLDGRGCANDGMLDVAARCAQAEAVQIEWKQGDAQTLPFGDDTFDAAMGVLTIHHWSDAKGGLSEMARVSRGPLVLLTFDASLKTFWLLDYFPALATLDDGVMPVMEIFGEVWGDVDVRVVPIPADCSDGFLAAYWRRPEAYLDPRLRAAMSSFWAIDGVGEGVAQLEADLESGAWEEKYGHLRRLEELDCGYRLVVAHT